MPTPSRHVLPRRMFLRGAVVGGATVAVPLPKLSGMLDGNGTAYADGTALPKRYGTWFFGNGIIPARWIPGKTGTGDAWALSDALAPLAKVKPSLTVVTGLRNKIPGSFAHKSHPAGALTGAQAVKDGDVQMPSIDQRIAAVIGKGTAFPTGLHVGISSVTGAGALDFNVSFNGANAPNPPEYNPVALFKKLMQLGSKTAEPDPSSLRRRRVLDAVAADAKSLRLRLGKDDQKRLDQHLAGLDELQGQITKTLEPRACGVLVDPKTTYPNLRTDGAITRERGKAFSDLLTFAMSCDLTRVWSYVFTCAACHGSYADAGLDNVTFHEDYGHRKSPKGRDHATEGFHKGIVYTMSCLADLAERLQATPDGAGTLLDSTAIYVTSCTSESESHSPADFPALVLGKAGGALRTDQHIRTNEENLSKVAFSLLKAFGSPDTKWGKDEGLVDAPLGGLLA